jgi:hypothetical protein
MTRNSNDIIRDVIKLSYLDVAVLNIIFSLYALNNLFNLNLAVIQQIVQFLVSNDVVASIILLLTLPASYRILKKTLKL